MVSGHLNALMKAVIGPSRPMGTWATTFEGIQVKGHSNATNAARVSWGRALLKSTWGDTPVKNHLNAKFAWKNSQSPATCVHTKRSTLMHFQMVQCRTRIFQMLPAWPHFKALVDMAIRYPLPSHYKTRKIQTRSSSSSYGQLKLWLGSFMRL